MLKELRLSNVQNTKRLVLAFDPKVTVLVGPSRSGKSTVVRALHLLAFNKPRGNGYVRHGSRFLRVQLGLFTGEGRGVRERVAEVRRGKGKNAYRLDGKRFAPEKRRSVPQAIEEVLNLGDVNFQQQDQAHLWLYESPGQVAKHLNVIADLETMDKVMRHVAARVRKAEAAVEVTKDRLRAAKDEAKRLAWVPRMLADLERLERLETAYRRSRVIRSSAERSVRSAVRHQSVIDRSSETILYAKKVERLGKKLQLVSHRASALTKLLLSIQSFSESPHHIPNIKKIVTLREIADRHAEKRRCLESLIQSATEKEQQWRDAVSALKATRPLPELRSGKRCPLCGSRVEKRNVRPVRVSSSQGSIHDNCTVRPHVKRKQPEQKQPGPISQKEEM